MADKFDPYWEWLKIPPEQQPPNHYQLLGLKSLESDPKLIDAAIDRLVGRMQGLSHGSRVEHAQSILNNVARARLCLSDPGKKAAYDQTLRAKLDVSYAKGSNGADESPSSNIRVGRKTNVSTEKNSAAYAKPSKPLNDEGLSSEQVKIRKVLTAAAGLGVLGAILGSGMVWFAMRDSGNTPSTQQVASSSSPSRVEQVVPQANLTEFVWPNRNVNPPKRESLTSNPEPPTKSLNETAPVTSVKPPQSESQSPTSTSTTPSPSTPNQTPSPSTNPTSSPQPTPNADTSTPTPNQDGVYPPAKPERFESLANDVIRIEGQVSKVDVSRSGKTAYLVFGRDRWESLSVRVRTDKVSQEQLRAFTDKRVRVRGIVKEKWGSDPVVLEIMTVDDIEEVK